MFPHFFAIILPVFFLCTPKMTYIDIFFSQIKTHLSLNRSDNECRKLEDINTVFSKQWSVFVFMYSASAFGPSRLNPDVMPSYTWCTLNWYELVIPHVQIACWAHLVMRTKTRTTTHKAWPLTRHRTRLPTTPSTCGTRTTWSSLCRWTTVPRPARCCWPPFLTCPLSSHTSTARQVRTLPRFQNREIRMLIEDREDAEPLYTREGAHQKDSWH